MSSGWHWFMPPSPVFRNQQYAAPYGAAQQKSGEIDRTKTTRGEAVHLAKRAGRWVPNRTIQRSPESAALSVPCVRRSAENRMASMHDDYWHFPINTRMVQKTVEFNRLFRQAVLPPTG
ncbi:MAG: hypothetical protein P8076_14615 [Gammaproteobacteria bacterium]|jgi:hypothetical protein